MSAQYAFFKNPPQPGDGGKQAFHPRIVPQGTKTTENIAQLIAESTSFSTADTKGVLEALGKWVAFYLSQGFNIELDGLGRFSISLQSEPAISTSDKNAQSVFFKDVNFRTAIKLRKKLKVTSFEKCPQSKPTPFTLEERKEHIVEYIRRQQSISRSTCMNINMCNKNIAVNDLNELIEAGTVGRIGDGRMVLYVLMAQE